MTAFCVLRPIRRLYSRRGRKVTFTVKLGTKDVSEESTMNLILVKESGEENLDYGVRAFSTFSAGYVCF